MSAERVDVLAVLDGADDILTSTGREDLHALACELDRVRAAVAELIADMRTIAELDPEQTPSGNNEWGEAECFGVAKRIARATLSRIGASA